MDILSFISENYNCILTLIYYHEFYEKGKRLFLLFQLTIYCNHYSSIIFLSWIISHLVSTVRWGRPMLIIAVRAYNTPEINLALSLIKVTSSIYIEQILKPKFYKDYVNLLIKSICV